LLFPFGDFGSHFGVESCLHTCYRLFIVVVHKVVLEDGTTTFLVSLFGGGVGD
jgi:hypothetical protein